MKPKWPTLIFEAFDILVPGLSSYGAKMYALVDPPRQKAILKTTEHSRTKTVLSRVGRTELFNPGLMNKLI